MLVGNLSSDDLMRDDRSTPEMRLKTYVTTTAIARAPTKLDDAVSHTSSLNRVKIPFRKVIFSNNLFLCLALVNW